MSKAKELLDTFSNVEKGASFNKLLIEKSDIQADMKKVFKGLLSRVEGPDTLGCIVVTLGKDGVFDKKHLETLEKMGYEFDNVGWDGEFYVVLKKKA